MAQQEDVSYGRWFNGGWFSSPPERTKMDKAEMARAIMSSKRGDYETPPEMVKDLAQVFKWNLDVCAERPNVCANYFDGEERGNGLLEDWFGLCWMNPPYGRERHIDWWLRKAVDEVEKEKAWAVVSLIPARTSTIWWHDYVPLAKFVVFVKGRLNYVNPQTGACGPAPFPSALVVFCNSRNDLTMAQVEKLCGYGWRCW